MRLLYTALRVLLAAAAAAMLASAQDIDAFFKDTFEQMVRNNPQFATGVGRHEYDDRWTDWSAAGREGRRKFYAERLSTAHSFDKQNLSPENLLTLRLVEFDFQSELDSWDLANYLLSVGQLFGFHNRVYVLMDRMPAHTVRDYANILSRLRAIPAYVDQNIAMLDEAIEKKITQPRLVADLVAQQIAAQAAQDAEHSHLLDPFRNFPSSVGASDQQRLKQEATDAYNTRFLPAWRKLHTYMTATYAQHVRPTDSISSLPNGRNDYAVLIRRMTTTSMSADQIHTLGEQEVKRIEGEMQALMKEANFAGTVADFQKHLDSMPEQHFQSKDEMLIYCRNIAKIIEPNLPNQFHHLPMLLYGVRPIPPDREAATATNAQAPSPDLTTPGWFNLNTYKPEKQVKYDKESLVLHEAVPGHVFQITLAQSQRNLPDIRKFYGNSAFVEGWALYAESLGAQLGLYKDPYSRFGQLSSERFRAVRLVVDTGIHQLGWTREQALAYFHEHAPEESAAEIDRYISWPAQALSYKMGQLRIRSLRDQAQERLGSGFDVRAFNDAVIQDGVLPLDLLSEQLTAFVMHAAATE